MAETGRKRPLLAAGLALLYPGLGHLYLRLWGRALMWFALVASFLVLLLPEDAFESADGGFVAAFWAAGDVIAALPLESQLALMAVTALQMVDAYVLARQRGSQASEGPDCPSCGKELDEDLDFCPWCTQRLDAGESA